MQWLPQLKLRLENQGRLNKNVNCYSTGSSSFRRCNHCLLTREMQKKREKASFAKNIVKLVKKSWWCEANDDDNVFKLWFLTFYMKIPKSLYTDFHWQQGSQTCLNFSNDALEKSNHNTITVLSLTRYCYVIAAILLQFTWRNVA